MTRGFHFPVMERNCSSILLRQCMTAFEVDLFNQEGDAERSEKGYRALCQNSWNCNSSLPRSLYLRTCLQWQHSSVVLKMWSLILLPCIFSSADCKITKYPFQLKYVFTIWDFYLLDKPQKLGTFYIFVKIPSRQKPLK